MDTASSLLRFDAFELDTGNRRLSRDGRPVELGSRYFDALVLLLRADGALVSKERFMDEVWRGVPVTDEALTQCIRTLRRALDDDAGSPRFIQTVPKHGYRFLASVESGAAASSARLPISRLAGACTIGGLAAGIAGGLAYGVLAGTGGASASLMLAAMVGALGTLAGAALGLAMAGALAWRGRADAMLVAAGGLGGLLAGVLGNMLAHQGVSLLTGTELGEVTGPLEGLLIGIATGCVAWLALVGRGRMSVLGSGLLAGIGAGVMIALADGTLLGGSLLSLQQQLPDMRLSLGQIGLQSGAAMAPTLASIVEATVFVLAMAAAALVAKE